MTKKPIVVLSLFYIVSTITCLLNVAFGLKLIRVVVPSYKLRGDQADLECHFELEGDTLYSVKWYKENEEFFRYVPKSDPPVYSYKVDGVKVDHENSGSNKVTLKGLTLKSSGLYRCEVSAEAPFFSSAQKEGRMEVVFLPKNGPHISGEKLEYQIDDNLDLNCTSGKSYPPSTLKWFINEKPVDETEMVFYPRQKHPHGLVSTVLGLRLTIKNRHFVNGSMRVRCVAVVTPTPWKSDRESILQRIDNREALLLVRNSCAGYKANYILILATTVTYILKSIVGFQQQLPNSILYYGFTNREEIFNKCYK